MIAVVHLVWGPLGPDPLERFLRSYRKHPAGADHELVILLNGVSADRREQLLAPLAGIEHRSLELTAPVQDLLAYRQAGERLEHDRLCLLNSHSVILHDGWLAKLDAALENQGAGVAGASGSWASLNSLALHELGIPSPYRGVLPPGRRVVELIAQIDRARGAVADEPAGHGGRGPLLRARTAAVVLSATAEQVRRFPRFPAPHIRTNAFLLPRERFCALRIGRITRKTDAYALESGRASLTRQLEGLGLRSLVVDADGTAWERDAWPRSGTLWQAGQEALLVADNQSALYEHGDLERRRMLAALAWGASAEPAPAPALAGSPTEAEER